MLEITLQIVKTRSCKNSVKGKYLSKTNLKAKQILCFQSSHQHRKKVKNRKKLTRQNATINKHLLQDKNFNAFIHFYYTNCFFSSSQKIVFFFCVWCNWSQHKNVRMINIRTKNIRMLIIYMVSIISITIFHLKRDLFIARLYFARLLLH